MGGFIKQTNTTTTLVIPRELRAEIQNHVEKDGRTMGSLIRELLTRYVDEQKAAQEVTA